MPGNTSFVAGFVQGMNVLFLVNLIPHRICAVYLSSKRRRHLTQHRRRLLRKSRRAMGRPALRIRALDVWKRNTGLSRAVRFFLSTSFSFILPAYTHYKFIIILLSSWAEKISGPGFRISDFESNRIIGNLQFEAARTVMSASSLTPVRGPVKSVHAYLNMRVVSFVVPLKSCIDTSR